MFLVTIDGKEHKRLTGTRATKVYPNIEDKKTISRFTVPKNPRHDRSQRTAGTFAWKAAPLVHSNQWPKLEEIVTVNIAVVTIQNGPYRSEP